MLNCSVSIQLRVLIKKDIELNLTSSAKQLSSPRPYVNETVQDAETPSPSTGSQLRKNYETDNSLAFTSEEKQKVARDKTALRIFLGVS